MSFVAQNKKNNVRRLILAGLLVVLCMIQNTRFLLPEPFGARAFLLIPAVVCIAMFEREISGIFFGLFAGILWDTFAARGFCFNAVVLTLIGFACGFLISHVVRNNILTVFILSGSALLLYGLVYFVVFYLFGSYEGAFLAYTKFFGASFVYTILFTPLFYAVVKAIAKKYSDSF